MFENLIHRQARAIAQQVFLTQGNLADRPEDPNLLIIAAEYLEKLRSPAPEFPKCWEPGQWVCKSAAVSADVFARHFQGLAQDEARRNYHLRQELGLSRGVKPVQGLSQVTRRAPEVAGCKPLARFVFRDALLSQEIHRKTHPVQVSTVYEDAPECHAAARQRSAESDGRFKGMRIVFDQKLAKKRWALR